MEADCVEAIYNLGLVNKVLGILSEALQAFEKLHTIIPNSPEVIYQIANLHDMLGNYRSATKYFNYLITKVPSDPGALSRLGQIFNKDEDENQAFHYHLEVSPHRGVLCVCGSLVYLLFLPVLSSRSRPPPSPVLPLLPSQPGRHFVAWSVVCQERDVRKGHRVL